MYPIFLQTPVTRLGSLSQLQIWYYHRCLSFVLQRRHASSEPRRVACRNTLGLDESFSLAHSFPSVKEKRRGKERPETGLGSTSDEAYLYIKATN